MLELIQKIKTYTEAGIILEHMELFDEVKYKIMRDRGLVTYKCQTCGLERTMAKSDIRVTCGMCYNKGDLSKMHEVEA